APMRHRRTAPARGRVSLAVRFARPGRGGPQNLDYVDVLGATPFVRSADAVGCDRSRSGAIIRERRSASRSPYLPPLPFAGTEARTRTAGHPKPRAKRP